MTNHDRLDEGLLRARQLKAEIDHFYNSYLQALGSVDINFQGELHKYACIRLAGFLEQLVHVAVDSYIRSTSSPAAAAFSSSYWKKAPNLTPDALKKLIARFDSDEWIVSLEKLAEESQIMDRLGVLLKVRNDSSHGKSYSGGRASLETHKHTVDELYKWVCGTFLSSSRLGSIP